MDGQLPGPVRARVRSHLVRCAPCRRELAELEALRQLLAGAPAPPPPPGLAETIVGHVRFREAERVRRRPRVRFWQGAIAGGVAAVLVVALWWAGLDGLSRMGHGSAPPAVEAALMEHSLYASLLETGAGDWVDWALVPAGDGR